jgi:hypothetical protein
MMDIESKQGENIKMKNSLTVTNRSKANEEKDKDSNVKA